MSIDEAERTRRETEKKKRNAEKKNEEIQVEERKKIVSVLMITSPLEKRRCDEDEEKEKIRKTNIKGTAIERKRKK